MTLSVTRKRSAAVDAPRAVEVSPKGLTKTEFRQQLGAMVFKLGDTTATKAYASRGDNLARLSISSLAGRLVTDEVRVERGAREFQLVRLSRDGSATFHPYSARSERMYPTETGALDFRDEVSKGISIPKPRGSAIELAVPGRDGSLVDVLYRDAQGKLPLVAFALENGALKKLPDTRAQTLRLGDAQPLPRGWTPGRNIVDTPPPPPNPYAEIENQYRGLSVRRGFRHMVPVNLAQGDAKATARMAEEAYRQGFYKAGDALFDLAKTKGKLGNLTELRLERLANRQD